MNASAACFPSSKAMLCLWHVNRAVLQHCRPFFVGKEAQADDQAGDRAWEEFYAFWHSIVASSSEQAYNDCLAQFTSKYNSHYCEPVGYIKTYWLEPYKEQIVKAWVNHSGGSVESGAETLTGSARYTLIKSHLKVSTFDLFDVWQAIKPAITNQLKELRHVRASQQVRIPIDVCGVLFEAVRGWVSHQALRLVQKQRQLVQRSQTASCSSTFTSSYGLPCSHTLRKLEEGGQPLLLEHFHPHWHLKRHVDPQRPVLEPRQNRGAVDTGLSQAKTSSRRGTSTFELSEPRRRAPSTCSSCHAVGHTMTSKKCPLRFKEKTTQVPKLAAPSRETQGVEHASDWTGSKGNVSEAARISSGDGMIEVPAGNREGPDELVPRSNLTPVPEASVRASFSISSKFPDANKTEAAFVEDPFEKISPPSGHTSQARVPYDSPEAIYARYVASRDAWYAEQPIGSVKTNQQYRRAEGLPQRRCVTAAGSREWTKEEMMAYLDFSRAEDQRVEAQVAKDLGANPSSNRRKGLKEVWESAEKDSSEQQAMYSLGGLAL
ncbi:hypothetical protein HIM_12019 [Hirsutella minnesotensis 3608]|uniref:Cytochrome c domain-containing protein n=1 Tax=Hirsutella minnesotensis 3608 TaxID=1043627 RepID=A0A0F7ZF62_9HYPO|nr:hypothetical protein HIM_12019 [Hirsutella minnesotensis 3608]